MHDDAPRQLRNALRSIRVWLDDCAGEAARIGDYDLACGLQACRGAVEAWEGYMQYDHLEELEQARSQLKFVGLDGQAPPPDVPF